MFACLLVASPAFAGFVNLPETGQTKCYDTAGTEVPCVGTGQDGEIQAGVVWPSPRFVANADTTITDNLTGLVWASNANIMPARNLGWDADGTLNDGAVTWQHALDYVVKLNAEQYLGYADWRLPNVNELESLVNAGEANTAAWLNTQGFTNVQFFTNAEDKKTTYYWTSTSYASTTTVACRVRLTDGWVCATTKSTNYYVWPVRGGQHLTQPAQVWKTGQTESYAAGDDGELEEGVAWPDPRFTDNGDGTVTDNLTGLMWTKDANGAGGTTDWYGALDYVWGMNAGTNPNYGYTDWRLPNRKEMYSLTDVSQYAPALPAGYPFTGVESDYYWSSTTYAYGCSNAWKVLMGYGLVHAYPKSDPSFSYVWPVRAGLHDHTDITPELAAEGMAREIVRRLQMMRRSAGFEIADHITTCYQGDEYIRRVIADFTDYIKQETLSEQLVEKAPEKRAYTESFKLEGHELLLGVKKLS